MPFASEKQRKYMWANKVLPEKELKHWESETKKKGFRKKKTKEACDKYFLEGFLNKLASLNTPEADERARRHMRLREPVDTVPEYVQTMREIFRDRQLSNADRNAVLHTLDKRPQVARSGDNTLHRLIGTGLGAGTGFATAEALGLPWWIRALMTMLGAGVGGTVANVATREPIFDPRSEERISDPYWI